MFEALLNMLDKQITQILNTSWLQLGEKNMKILLFSLSGLWCNLQKGLDHSGAGSDSSSAFSGSQWVRQLKFSAYASFLISWSLSKFELI